MRVAEKAGWTLRRSRGDHFLYEKPGVRGVPIPDHRELDPGTLRGIIRQLGLTVDEFLEALKK